MVAKLTMKPLKSSDSLFYSAFPLALAVLIVLFARGLAVSGAQMVDAQVAAVMQNLDYHLPTENKAVSIKGQVQFTINYGIGLADALIRFENLPREVGPTYLNILGFLTEGIQIDKFIFENRAVSMVCTAPDLTTVEVFRQSLSDSGFFAGVTADSYFTTDGEVRSTLECLL